MAMSIQEQRDFRRKRIQELLNQGKNSTEAGQIAQREMQQQQSGDGISTQAMQQPTTTTTTSREIPGTRETVATRTERTPTGAAVGEAVPGTRTTTGKLMEGGTGPDTAIPPGGVAGPKTTTQRVPGSETSGGQFVAGGAPPGTLQAALQVQPDIDPETGQAGLNLAPLAQAGQAEISAEEAAAQGELARQQGVQEEAQRIAAGARDETGRTISQAIDIQARAQGEEGLRQHELESQRKQLEQFPEQIKSEFDAIRQQFDQQASFAFDRLEGDRAAALGEVYKGQSSAMTAAVQGAQGQVNSQVAAIQANPNLSAGQKQSMIAQVRLAGSQAIGPAIGANIAQFTGMAVDVQKTFGNLSAQITSQVVGAQAQLAGLQGQAYAQAKTATNQMANQLLEIDASADAAFVNGQSNLLGQRTQAEMSGNQVLLQTLPEMGEPYLDLTGSTHLQTTYTNDLIMKQLSFQLQERGFEFLQEMVQSQKDTGLLQLVLGAALQLL